MKKIDAVNKQLRLKRAIAKQLAVYDKDIHFFHKSGFDRETAEQIIIAAKGGGLKIWDMYHIFRYAQRIPPNGAYLEIGSFKGGSLNAAYLGTKRAGISANFVAIDQHFADGFEKKTKSISNLRTIEMLSSEAKSLIKDDSMDLLFIDGDHRYENVRTDFLDYWPKLKINGIFLGHDYFTARGFGVRRAADELFGEDIIHLKNSRIFKIKKTDAIILPKT